MVVEIDITSSLVSRLSVYAALGVSEAWRYDGTCLKIYRLQGQEYVLCSRSPNFPKLSAQEVSRFLEQTGTVDYLDLVNSFRS